VIRETLRSLIEEFSLNPISTQELWILGGLAAAWLVVTLPLVWSAWKKEAGPRFEFHWGGLGRGLGGWTLNWTMVLGILSLVLTIGGVAAVVQIVTPQAKPAAVSEGKADTATSDSPAVKSPETPANAAETPAANAGAKAPGTKKKGE
jgi:hypothetical protein